MISARTEAAPPAARARGVALGTPHHGQIARHAHKGNQASATARSVAARARAMDVLPFIQSVQADGVMTLAGIAETLNERGIPAPRGGSWSPVQVSRVLALV
jgi:Recombinase